MNDLTIIVDGNYLAYKCMNIAKGFDKTKYDENNKFLSKSKEVTEFVTKMVTDLVYSLNLFHGYKKVIFTKDSKSWRKDINIPDHDGYKSSRKQGDDVNWPLFYHAMDEFVNIISKHGIIVSTIEGAEGDDLIYLWAEYINTKETPDNVVIFTGDGDLAQVVNFNDQVYTVAYDTKQKSNRIIGKIGIFDWINKKNNTIIDIFNDGDLNKLLNKDGIDVLKQIIINTPIEEVDPKEVVLNKIICGDDGDTVPSIWEWGRIKENKRYEKRITNKHYAKVFEYIKETYHDIDINQLLTNSSFKNKVRLILQESAKINMPIDSFKEKLNINATLTYLDRSVLPKTIIDEFDTTKEKMYNNAYSIQFNKNILNGTRYEIKKTEVLSDIFKMY